MVTLDIYVKSIGSQNAVYETSGSPQDSQGIHEVKIIYLLHRISIFTNATNTMVGKTVDYLAEIKDKSPNY